MIFGAIQGLTEFLPVSSSGHLVILHRLTGLQGDGELSFDVALHFGTLLALLVFFWGDVVKLLQAWAKSIWGWRAGKLTDDARLAWQILAATVPVLIVGGLGGDLLEQRFRTLPSVAVMLIVFGLLFFVFEAVSRQRHRVTDLSWASALKIGCAQVLALIPGVSRSGVTIIAGLGEGLKRSEAARFSFLLSIPAVAAAAAKQGIDLSQTGIDRTEWLNFGVGVFVAAVVGWLAIRYLLRFLENHTLALFGWYRLALGVLALALWYW